MLRGLAYFWYRFKNWFRTKPGPGETLRFLCGSEEELRHVSRWMCQAVPSLFKQELVVINYQGTHGKCEGGITFSGDFQYHLSAGEAAYLRRASALILQHNQFTGTTWLRDLNTQVQQPKTLFGFFEWPKTMWVEVVQPSQPEQFQSRRAFAQWLDGKVSEQEKRELLQLPD